MANKMLIDATHPEETRVVVLRGNRVEEFDFETAHRKQLRGNIYLAKVTRVEPSLQAAFVDYGGNRHGFLAFSEIHPDYYQIPVADRQALLDEDARAHRDGDDEDEEPRRSSGNGGGRRRGRGRNRNREARRSDHSDDAVRSDALPADAADAPADAQPAHETTEYAADGAPYDQPAGEHAAAAEGSSEQPPHFSAPAAEPAPIGETANPPVPAEIGADNPLAQPAGEQASEPAPDRATPDAEMRSAHDAAPADDKSRDDSDRDARHDDADTPAPAFSADAASDRASPAEHDDDGDEEEDEPVDTVGGADAMEEVMERAPRYRRQYKIQEVIKRRQVMLVQVVKEERGTKGAALTTYLSLAGRYSVLMPNTARGGGISRKITSGEDRKRLREIADELEVPEGMGVILRTAGAARTKAEVKRDFEYLMRLWETVRDLTLKSTAPTLVYEEGSLAKRSIRDLYSKDIEEIVVAGEGGYRDAKDFMRMLMPSHAKNVKLYKDSQPVFARYGIESQLDAMFSPTVQLRSGGYIVINQTEALVAIDVNSGRSTREHHIEDTALKTNVEAAEEVARQLRLRDLAGLIVIDFIDMDEKRNNRTVESRLKSALRNDRARIQVGRISHFGLMEMSRQRIRTSVLESSTEKCPHCGGTGHIRSVSSVALQLLRTLEETLQKGATHNQICRTRPEIALYVLNHKRAHLRALEERYKITITIDADESINGTVTYAIDRGEQVMTLEQAKALAAQHAVVPLIEEEEPEIDAAFEADEIEEAAESAADQERFAPETDDDADAAPEQAAGDREDGESENGGRKRRRRRRGRGERGAEGRNGDGRGRTASDQPQAAADADGVLPEAESDRDNGQAAEDGDQARSDDANGVNGEPRRRRRGRRGGRRNRRDRDEPGFRDTDGPHQDQPAEPPHPYEQSQQPYPAAPDIAEETPVPTRQPVAAEAVVEPVAAVPLAQQPAAAATDATPRRRSTVREPAPVSADSRPAETPAPMPPADVLPTPVVVSSAEADDASKPRRTGWWAKRLLGGDKT